MKCHGNLAFFLLMRSCNKVLNQLKRRDLEVDSREGYAERRIFATLKRKQIEKSSARKVSVYKESPHREGPIVPTRLDHGVYISTAEVDVPRRKGFGEGGNEGSSGNFSGGEATEQDRR